MKIFENDNVVFFDCDETLVIWNYAKEDEQKTIKFDNYGYDVHLLPHYEHMKLLQQFKARGHVVIVWTQGGFDWGKKVVETLGLSKFVDAIVCKPKWYVDDLPCEAFMGKPFYIPIGKKLPVLEDEDKGTNT